MHVHKWSEGNKLQAILAKWLDWPPVWTLSGLALIWVLALIPLPGGFGVFGPGLALACLVLALWLMGRAALRMARLRTTLNPRGQPRVLVTDGVFGLSRNPIYLGDALLLLAAAFWTDSLAGLVVVAGFLWIVTARFIRVEEGRLVETFGVTAEEWFSRVRRWI